MMEAASLNRYQLAELGALLAEPSRAAMLLALMDGPARPAGELARAAGVGAATASAHLKRLLEGPARRARTGTVPLLPPGQRRGGRVA